MGENINNIKHLLQNVSTIKKKYDDIAIITGENFNIFSILRMDSNEVRMHSAFIGELLNPKGSHGLKEVPLEIFVSLLNSKFNQADTQENETKFNKDKFILDTDSAVTTVEKYIGFTNEYKTEGGRIDIITEDKNKNAIIIENKIYAIEQTNQLIRYNNYLKDAPILYLTLHGNAPTSHGELRENIDYFIISYKDDIKNWLKLCLKEAVDFPMLREVIKQYLYLIKKLTNQTINEKMSEEIIKTITNSTESIKASKLIVDNYQNALNALKSKVVNALIQILVKNGFKEEEIDIKRSGRPDGFFLVLKTFDLKENGSYDLGINVELDGNKYFFCVIKQGENRNASINTKLEFYEIKEYLNKRIKNLISNGWAIGFSDNLKIGINTDEYYLRAINNEEIYNELAKTFINYKNLLNQ